MGLKLPSPLRVKNRLFGAVFGRRGDAGFSGSFLGPSRGVVGFNLAMFLRPVREKVRPARPGAGASAKKFAQRAQNTPNRAISGEQGESCTGNGPAQLERGEFCPAHVVRRGLPGEFYTGSGPTRSLVGECYLTSAHPRLQLSISLHPRAPWPGQPRPPYRWQWGFGSIRRWLSACRRRVAPLMVQFPPIGGGPGTEDRRHRASCRAIPRLVVVRPRLTSV